MGFHLARQQHAKQSSKNAVSTEHSSTAAMLTLKLVAGSLMTSRGQLYPFCAWFSQHRATKLIALFPTAILAMFYRAYRLKIPSTGHAWLLRLFG